MHSALLKRTSAGSFRLPCGIHLSLRLGHARGLTVHRTVIQYPRVTSLPLHKGGLKEQKKKGYLATAHSVIPSGRNGIRRLLRLARDLRVGAFNPLGFGKREPSHLLRRSSPKGRALLSLREV